MIPKEISQTQPSTAIHYAKTFEWGEAKREVTSIQVRVDSELENELEKKNAFLFINPRSLSLLEQRYVQPKKVICVNRIFEAPRVAKRKCQLLQLESARK